jgi:PHD/YefM family antitoxin component YafN of YafNO toxin-antitoxin module
MRQGGAQEKGRGSMSDIKMPISMARDELNKLPKRLQEENATIEVTQRGKSVLAILPWDAYDAIRETLEVMNDRELMKRLRASIKQAEAGELIPWEEAKKEL